MIDGSKWLIGAIALCLPLTTFPSVNQDSHRDAFTEKVVPTGPQVQSPERDYGSIFKAGDLSVARAGKASHRRP